MYWGIFDEVSIRTIQPRTPRSVLIRILEPSYLSSGIPYEIQTIHHYQAVLDLYFDDIREKREDIEDLSWTLFQSHYVEQLVEFLQAHPCDEINVHCSAGISRSSALMICIARLFNLKEIETTIWQSQQFSPNPFMLQVFEQVFDGQFVRDLSHQTHIPTYRQRNTQTPALIEVEPGIFQLN